jgi:non-ribosomal peptide synthetase component F
VFWHRRTFGITASDRASHLAGLAFDAAVWKLWPHLSAGATVVLLADGSVRMSPRHLRDWIARSDACTAIPATACPSRSTTRDLQFSASSNKTPLAIDYFAASQ